MSAQAGGQGSGTARASPGPGTVGQSVPGSRGCLVRLRAVELGENKLREWRGLNRVKSQLPHIVVIDNFLKIKEVDRRYKEADLGSL